jgi:adenylyltransferase/sulfurtransferase
MMDANRYIRQLDIPGWGLEGQERLGRSTVFIGGLGGLGSSTALYLAAAGIGCLRICDTDQVEISNLNRQVLYTVQDLGKPKSGSAMERIGGLNNEIDIIPLQEEIKQANVDGLVGDAEILVDCLDNFHTRKILNRYAVYNHLPLVHAGVLGMSGQLSFIHPPGTPCLKCVYKEMDEPQPEPVVGAIAGVLGSLQALETIKFLTGMGETLEGRMLMIDGMSLTCHEIRLLKNPDCPVCSKS